MSKAFILHDGSFPDPAYVDDPAGGRAMQFTNSHTILAAHTDFGNVGLFPSGTVGDVTMTMTMRAALDINIGAGTDRTILEYRPARWTGAAWEFPYVTTDIQVAWEMREVSGVDVLQIAVWNKQGGELGDRKWFRLTGNQTQAFCDGTLREFRWQTDFKNMGSSSSNFQRFWVDGDELTYEPSWISRNLDFSIGSGDPLVGAIVLGGRAAGDRRFTGKISAFRMELKDNT